MEGDRIAHVMARDGPVHAGVMRPSRETPVASNFTSPAPPRVMLRVRAARFRLISIVRQANARIPGGEAARVGILVAGDPCRLRCRSAWAFQPRYSTSLIGYVVIWGLRGFMS